MTYGQTRRQSGPEHPDFPGHPNTQVAGSDPSQSGPPTGIIDKCHPVFSHGRPVTPVQDSSGLVEHKVGAKSCCKLSGPRRQSVLRCRRVPIKRQAGAIHRPSGPQERQCHLQTGQRPGLECQAAVEDYCVEEIWRKQVQSVKIHLDRKPADIVVSNRIQSIHVIDEVINRNHPMAPMAQMMGKPAIPGPDFQDNPGRFRRQLSPEIGQVTTSRPPDPGLECRSSLGQIRKTAGGYIVATRSLPVCKLMDKPPGQVLPLRIGHQDQGRIVENKLVTTGALETGIDCQPAFRAIRRRQRNVKAGMLQFHRDQSIWRSNRSRQFPAAV